MSADGRNPAPEAACRQWIAACRRAGWRDLPEAEQVPVGLGLDRVTLAPVCARWPSPRFACAAMDGVAVRAGSLPSWEPAGSALTALTAPTVPTAPSGQVRLAAGEFSWIDTGDPLPACADTVVVRERVERHADGSVTIVGPVTCGHHVRAVGEDFGAGQLLVPAGRRLRPGDLASAAAAGHAELTVARQPVVAIIPTGDEIRPVGTVPERGEVIDSSSVLLAARAAQAGAVPWVTGIQPDDPDVLAAELRRAALAADVVVVIAGSSAGRDDHTAAVLAQVGDVVVHGVAVRPGHPALLGYAKQGHARDRQPAGIVPVIGLPGYPLATAVIFELFALPLLAALQGAAAELDRSPQRGRQRARLAIDWKSPVDLEDWVPVTLRPAPEGCGESVEATPSRRGAGATSQLGRADAWWRIPIGQSLFTRGQRIDVQPISAGHF